MPRPTITTPTKCLHKFLREKFLRLSLNSQNSQKFSNVKISRCTVVWSRPFQVEREEGSGDTAIPNVCLALRSVRANQIARATCYFPSHVTVIQLLSQWRWEDNLIHSQSKKITEFKATLAAHFWTRLQRHCSQWGSYWYDINKCLNYSTFVLMIALAILEEQR